MQLRYVDLYRVEFPSEFATENHNIDRGTDIQGHKGGHEWIGHVVSGYTWAVGWTTGHAWSKGRIIGHAWTVYRASMQEQSDV